MAVPTHVKVIVSIVSFILAVAGSRDIFFPGSGVPFPPNEAACEHRGQPPLCAF